jgi:hypothetical protein
MASIKEVLQVSLMYSKYSTKPKLSLQHDDVKSTLH